MGRKQKSKHKRLIVSIVFLGLAIIFVTIMYRKKTIPIIIPQSSQVGDVDKITDHFQIGMSYYEFEKIVGSTMFDTPVISFSDGKYKDYKFWFSPPEEVVSSGERFELYAITKKEKSCLKFVLPIELKGTICSGRIASQQEKQTSP